MVRFPGALLLACSAMAQLQKLTPPPNQPPLPTGHGVIEGTVVDAGTHEPLKKVRVTIALPLQTQPVAVTDASGRFVFRELPAGVYGLNASKPGYRPMPDSFGTTSGTQVMVGADETKKGVEIALTPGSSISGRVVNEDGVAVRNCNVTVVQPGYQHGSRTLNSVAGGSGTGDKGEYRIPNVPPGRYYLFTHCAAELPAAHPLLPRGDPRIPHDTYLPQFYGGSLDPASATKVAVTAGATLDGIDFEVRRTRGFTLRVNVTGADAEGLTDNVMLMMQPANLLLRNLMQLPARQDHRGHSFYINSVIPGSYRLIAISAPEGHAGYAERTVEVGATPPEPVEVAITTSAVLKGSIQFDGDEHPPLESVQLFLNAVGADTYLPQPHAEVTKDGTFTFASAPPGRWRLGLNTSGYVKSMSMAGQPVSPNDFQMAPGAGGPLQVTLGMKMAEINVTVTGLAAGAHAAVLVFPEDLDLLGSGLERIAAGGSQQAMGGLHPGHYRLLATDASNPWILLQKPEVLKALEGSSQAIDLPAGGHVSATVELIPREELLRLIAEKEQ